MKRVQIGEIWVGECEPLVVIAGPCVIESEDAALFAAEEIKKRLSAPFIFKSSYDKANRTSIDSFRGPGLDEGLRILERIRDEVGVPVNTDVHTPEQARAAAQVCDSIQIPAFLCRQTDLVVAAGKTGKPLLVKKGQFMAPWDMKAVVEKIPTDQIVLLERGTSFGYNTLISDFRSLPIMQELGYPVCFDASHSVMSPGGHGSHSGGQREFIAPLCRAAVGVGVQCLFIETHPEPKEALSDAQSMLNFDELERVVAEAVQLDEARRCFASL